MILLCGIPTESPLALVSKALDKHDVPYVLLNQRKFSIMKAHFEISGGRASGKLQMNGDSYQLDDFSAVFSRLMDYRFLPEIKDTPENSPDRQLGRNLFDTLTRWAEIAPARVVNRMAPMGSNFSSLPSTIDPALRF